MIAEGFNKEFPRAPFTLWKDIDPEFKDLVGKMTNIDPKRRITAHEAFYIDGLQVERERAFSTEQKIDWA